MIRISTIILLHLSVLNFEIQAQTLKISAKASIIKQQEFGREQIIKKLNSKIQNKEPLFVHVFVPLCDNDYQGIVKVGGKLGEGRNLKTNLYWGAGYGLKTFFFRHKNWTKLSDSVFTNGPVLERLVFSRKYTGKTEVFLVIDAYAGDKMKDCLTDYFESLAGKRKEKIQIKSDTIFSHGNADFLIFNGHNGLMDTEMPVFRNVDNVEKDAAVIACASYQYFIKRFQYLKAYPLLTTTNLLPPEAYIISAVIDGWATMQADLKIRDAAGEAMAKIHNKNPKYCIPIFATGW